MESNFLSRPARTGWPRNRGHVFGGSHRWRSGERAALKLVGLLLSLTLGSSCTLRYDFQECRTLRDCEPLETEGRLYTCGPENKCEPIECRVNFHCLEQGSNSTCDTKSNTCVMAGRESDAGNNSDAAMMVSCSAHSDCVRALGPGQICSQDSTCTALQTSLCSKVLFPPSFTQENPSSWDQAIFLGSLMPISPPFEALGVPLQNAVELGVADFNTQVGELSADRPVIWLGCDTKGSAEAAEAAAIHLVDHVGAQVLIGPVFSGPFLQVAENVTLPRKILHFAPTATVPAIAELDDLGLIWRLIPSDLYQGASIVNRIGQLRLARTGTSGAIEQVVLLVKDDAYGRGLHGQIEGPLRELLGANQVYSAYFADPSTLNGTAEALQNEFSRVISDVVTRVSSPDVIVLIGTNETNALAESYLLGTNYPTVPAPHFIVSHGGVPTLAETFTNLVQKRPLQLSATQVAELSTHFEGTTPNILSPENFVGYNVRYRIRFNATNAVTSSSTTYDATIMALLSMTALLADSSDAEHKFTGPKLAQKVPQLLSPAASAVDISFSQDRFIAQAAEALRSGSLVDLDGTSGSLVFDTNTGEVINSTPILGWDVVLQSGRYAIDARRVYTLRAAPNVEGSWRDL